MDPEFEGPVPKRVKYFGELTQQARPSATPQDNDAATLTIHSDPDFSFSNSPIASFDSAAFEDAHNYVPNFTQAARNRVTSNGSSVSQDSTWSTLSGKAPLAPKPECAPFEQCLLCYPVMAEILANLPTPAIMRLAAVSRSFQSFINTCYVGHWKNLLMVKDPDWLRKKYIPRTAMEKLELDGTHLYLCDYVVRKIEEEQKALERVRNVYDSDVFFLFTQEMGLLGRPYSFQSGGRPGREKGKAELPLPIEISSISIAESPTVAAEIERTLPITFFYSTYGSRSLMSALCRACIQLNQMRPSAPWYSWIKTLIIDGTNVSIGGLLAVLTKFHLGATLEGISARACHHLRLDMWASSLNRQRDLVPKLKWLNIFPNEDFPLGPFACDTAESLIALYYLNPESGEDAPEAIEFIKGLTLKEHLQVTLPLLVTNTPADYEGLEENSALDRARFLTDMQACLLDCYQTQPEQWPDFLLRVHPLLKVLAICQVRGIKLDYNLCACGVKCASWATAQDIRDRGDLAPDEDATLVALMRVRDPDNVGTHTIGSRMRQEQGGQKCANCHAWEWEGEGARSQGFLHNAHDSFDDEWEERDGKLYQGKEHLMKIVWGPDNDPSKYYPFDQAEAAAYNMLTEVGGVKFPRIRHAWTRVGVDGKVHSGLYHTRWPTGLGAGGICEPCAASQTCWGCSKFYCQLCLYGPNPSEGALPELKLNRELLINACKARKHNPLCKDCYRKFSVTCDHCLVRYCSICNPGGVGLQLNDPGDYQSRTVTEREVDAEDYGYDQEMPTERVEPSMSFSEPYDADYELLEDGEREEVRAEEEIADRDRIVEYGHPGEELTTTIAEAVEELTTLRRVVGGWGVLQDVEDVTEADFPEVLHNREFSPESDPDIDAPPDEDEEYEQSHHENESPETFAREFHSTKPPHRPPLDLDLIATLQTYNNIPAHFPSFQAKMVRTNAVEAQKLEKGTNYVPVQVWSKCDFCACVICAVCSKGRTNIYAAGWDWDRCGGCGKMMCGPNNSPCGMEYKGCCKFTCMTCARPLCVECEPRERLELWNIRQECGIGMYEWGGAGSANPTSPSPAEMTMQECVRCELRRVIVERKLLNGMIMDQSLAGPYVDESLRVDPWVNINTTPGPHLHLQSYVDQLTPCLSAGINPEQSCLEIAHHMMQDFDHGGLVGSFNRELEGQTDALGEGVSLLTEGVGNEFHWGLAGAAGNPWAGMRRIMEERGGLDVDEEEWRAIL